MGHEAAEIAAYNTVPCGTLSLVKLDEISGQVDGNREASILHA